MAQGPAKKNVYPVHHDELSGLGDDDHSQYLNTTRHDADDHSGLLPIDHGTDVTGLGDDDHSFYPKGVLGYAEITSSQGSIGASDVDITGLSVTVDVAASRRIRITTLGLMLSTVANDQAGIQIKEGSTRFLAIRMTLPVANRNETVQGSVVITPSEGSHTYKFSAVRAVGSGTLTVVAISTSPAFILVEDIGPA